MTGEFSRRADWRTKWPRSADLPSSQARDFTLPRPVRLIDGDLIEIDRFDLQRRRLSSHSRLNGIGMNSFPNFFPLVPGNHLGEYVGAGRATPSRAGYDFFRVAQPVDGGGIDPVDPTPRAMNREGSASSCGPQQIPSLTRRGAQRQNRRRYFDIPSFPTFAFPFSRSSRRRALDELPRTNLFIILFALDNIPKKS